MTLKLYERNYGVSGAASLIGLLDETISASVTDTLGGIPEITFRYPCSGSVYSQITPGRVVVCKSSPRSADQPFRITGFTKQMNGLCTFTGRHLIGDLDGVPIISLSDSEIVRSDVIRKFGTAYASANRFGVTVYGTPEALPTFTWSWGGSSDEDDEIIYDVLNPGSALSYLLADGGIMDQIGCELEFSGLTVREVVRRGRTRSAPIDYGKNLTAFKLERDEEARYNAILPFYRKADGTIITGAHVYAEDPVTLNPAVHEDVQIFDESASYRVNVVDMTREVKSLLRIGYESFDDDSTDLELAGALWNKGLVTRYRNEHADEFAAEQSLTADFVPLEMTAEYFGESDTEVDLGDTVTIRHFPLGVTVTDRITKTVYDPIAEKYTGFSVGKEPKTIVDTIARIAGK